MLTVIFAAGAIYIFTGNEKDTDGEDNTQEQDDLFFFGDTATSTPTDDTNNDDLVDVVTQEEFSLLYNKMSDRVLSEGLTYTPNGTTLIRAAERSTGHIYEFAATSTYTARISNTTIPRIQNVEWISSERVVMQFLESNTDDIRTFLAHVVPSVGDDEAQERITGIFLPRNITSLTVSPDGERIFYIIERSDGVEGIIADNEGQTVRSIFNSPSKSWSAHWAREGTITLKTKPSAFTQGYVFALNPSNGSLRQVFGKYFGLTALASPEESTYIFSQTQRGEVTTHLYNNGQIATLPIRTFAEKCVWSSFNEEIVYCAVPRIISRGTYPDDWYKGSVSFSDVIWQINTDTLEASIVLDPRSYEEEEIDAINLTLSGTDDFLVFRNKKDSTLWNFDLRRND